MTTFDFWEVLVALVVVGWLAYRIGKVRGRELEREAHRLYVLADKESNPEKKRDLLLRWNELSDSSRIRTAFRVALLSSKSRKKSSD